MKQFKVVGYSTGKPHTTDIVKAMLEPFSGTLLDINEFHTNGLADADIVVISGILRGSGLVYKQCVQEKRNFCFIDHAYFNKGYEYPTWMRVTLNRHVFGGKLIGSNSQRFDQFFSKYKLQAWRGGQGKHILVMPPTHAIGWLFDAHDWETKVLAQLRQVTDRPIKIRNKPNNPVVDDKGNLLYIENNSVPSLAEDLKDAYAAVIYNSNSAIECIQAGVPVICEEACAAKPIAFDLSAIDSNAIAIEPQRQQLFNDLANSQFTKEEIRMGKTFLR